MNEFIFFLARSFDSYRTSINGVLTHSLKVDERYKARCRTQC